MANTSSITLRRFSDRDHGASALRSRLAKIVHPTVRVGIYGEAASREHADSKLSNVDIASVHEFGSEHVPERSFIRATVDEQRERIKDVQRRTAGLFMTGKISMGQALGIIGETVTSAIKAKIDRGIEPPLAAETIRRKGSSKPLVDTAQMKNSIAWEVSKQ